MKLSPNSIAPYPQEKPPVWSILALVVFVVLALSPFFFVVASVLGVMP